MDRKQRQIIADERAEAYAPKPTGGIFMAGFCGAVLGLLADVVISRFYGWRLVDHPLMTALGMIAGFLIVFIGYARHRRRNRMASLKELKKIDQDQGDPE